MNQEAEHLRMLAIFHYVVAGIACVISFIPTIHLAIGIAMVSGIFRTAKDPFPFEFMGWFFIVIASLVILCGLAFSICLFIAGRFLHKQTHYTYCLVMAAVSCIFMPFGTVLGVFTIILLMKENVKVMFQEPGTARTTAPDPEPGL
jgi:hypothetical protein